MTPTEQALEEWMAAHHDPRWKEPPPYRVLKLWPTKRRRPRR